MRKKFSSVLIAVAALFVFVSPVFAQEVSVGSGDTVNICTFIKPICTALGINLGDPESDGADAAFDFIRARANTLLSLLFVGIILISVFIIIQAGIKYIQSQGDEKQIGEAQKAIKTVFIGIGVLFVGVAGLVLVLAFFGGLGLLSSGTQINDVICPQDATDCGITDDN